MPTASTHRRLPAAPLPTSHTVRRIAVLRPNAIGDFVFALPALHALRASWPHAHITLLGRAWHHALLAGRPGPVDEVVVMPTLPGVGAPEDASAEPNVVEPFMQSLRQARFDIAIQLYGGGRYTNPFVASLGAALTVGMQAEDASPLDRNLPYERWRNERLRLLEVVGLAGATPRELNPRLTVTAHDHAVLAATVALPHQPLAVLQPGATDERRRWPVERFAEVGRALAEAGAFLVINGSEAERPLTARLSGLLQVPHVDLAGRLPLTGLLALLQRARLLISNDTGPLHLASALGCPSVGIYWAMNLITAAPLVQGRQRAILSMGLMCPVCGVENVRQRCPHQVSFVDDVGVDEVRQAALAEWHAGPGGHTAPVSQAIPMPPAQTEVTRSLDAQGVADQT